MNIEVLFFAQVRESFGTDRASMDVEPGATVDGLVQRLTQAPEWRPLGGLPLTFAVNEKIVAGSHTLSEGDRLALLTPVAGG